MNSEYYEELEQKELEYKKVLDKSKDIVKEPKALPPSQ